MSNRFSFLAALIVAAAASSLPACASQRPAPVFSKDSPADPRAPAAPPAVVESLAGPAASPSAAPKPASGNLAAPAGPAKPAVYVCPMHPQSTKDRPGSCPVCGMALVKAKPKGASKP